MQFQILSNTSGAFVKASNKERRIENPKQKSLKSITEIVEPCKALIFLVIEVHYTFLVNSTALCDSAGQYSWVS